MKSRKDKSLVKFWTLCTKGQCFQYRVVPWPNDVVPYVVVEVHSVAYDVVAVDHQLAGLVRLVRRPLVRSCVAVDHVDLVDHPVVARIVIDVVAVVVAPLGRQHVVRPDAVQFVTDVVVVVRHRQLVKDVVVVRHLAGDVVRHVGHHFVNVVVVVVVHHDRHVVHLAYVVAEDRRRRRHLEDVEHRVDRVGHPVDGHPLDANVVGRDVEGHPVVVVMDVARPFVTDVVVVAVRQVHVPVTDAVVHRVEIVAVRRAVAVVVAVVAHECATAVGMDCAVMAMGLGFVTAVPSDLVPAAEALDYSVVMVMPSYL